MSVETPVDLSLFFKFHFVKLGKQELINAIGGLEEGWLPLSRGSALKSMINKFKTHNKLSWEMKIALHTP